MLEAKAKYPILTPQNSILRVSIKDIPIETLVDTPEFTLRVYRVGTEYLYVSLAPYTKQGDILLFNLDPTVFVQGEGRYAYELYYQSVLLATQQFVFALEPVNTATENAAPYAAPPVTATKAVALHNADPLAHKALFDAYKEYVRSLPVFNGDYNALINKPELFSGSYLDLTDKPALFSGSYLDLTDKPALFDGNYNSLTNKPALFDGTYASLTGKPTLFSGAYADLTGKPVLFDGNYNSLTNKPTIPSQYTDAQARSVVVAALVHAHHTNITATYDAGNSRILLAGNAGGGGSTKTRQFVATTATLTPAATDEECGTNAQAAALTIAAPAGTAWVDGDTIVFRFKDDGTARNMAWDAAYVYFGGASFPATTAAGKWMYFTAIYNAVAAKWHVMAAQVEPGGWSTTWDGVATTDSAGWGGYTLRAVVPAASLAAGSKVRMTLAAGTSGCVVAKAYVGLRAASGDDYDFESTPTRMTFGGAAGVSIPGNGTVICDDVALTIPSGRALVLAVYFTSGSIKVFANSAWTEYDKSGDDAATVNASGYSSPVSNPYMVKKIEVFS